MPNNNDNKAEGFDLEKLKNDPLYWMRLYTPEKESDTLTCLFFTRENPFTNPDGKAMEQVEKLAKEGKLYVREEGRANHFRKVEQDGDSLKLGGVNAAKVDGPYDMVLALLMRASRIYFNGLGFERIANWFGRRVDSYDSYNELRAQSKAEYKAMSKEDRDKLNKLRKQEKAAEKLQKRLEKLQKLLESTKQELESTQQELNQVWNGDSKGRENEPTPQQTQPTTEQTPPTTEQTPPTTEQTPPTTEQTPPTTEQTPPTTEQTPPTNTNVADGLPEFQLIVGGKEYNNKNIHMAPEDVKRMVKLLEEIGKQLESQQATQNNAENLLDFNNPVNAPVNNELPFVDFTRNQDGNLIDDNIPVNAPVNNELPFVDFTGNQDGNLIDDEDGNLIDDEDGNLIDDEDGNLIDDEDGNLIDDNTPVNAPVNNEVPFVDFTANQNGNLIDDEDGNLIDDEDGNLIDDEDGNLIDDEDGNLIDDEDGNLIDDNTPVNASVNNEVPFVDFTANQNGNLIDDEDGNLIDDEDGNLIDDEDGNLIDDEDGNLIDDEDGNLIDDEDGNLIDDDIPVNASVNNEVPFADFTARQDDIQIEIPPQEPDRVNIQERPAEQAQQQPTTQERLAAEKQRFDSAVEWQGRIANALFSHNEGQDIKAEYEAVKESPNHVGRNMLMTAAMGIFANVANINGGPENSQKMIDALLSGQSLGSEHDASIHGAYAAAKNAWREHGEGQSQGLKDLLKDSICELSKQAGQETVLSDRLVMIGKMISACNDIAKECGLKLGLNENEKVAAEGAVDMAKMALKYHNARQYLSGEPKDLSSGRGAQSVRDLLVGKALEAMLEEDGKNGEEITYTQKLVGSGAWSKENLAQMAYNSTIRKNITQETVSRILDNPDGMIAHITGANLIKEMIYDSRQQQPQNNAAQKQLNVEQEMGMQNPMG